MKPKRTSQKHLEMMFSQVSGHPKTQASCRKLTF